MNTVAISTDYQPKMIAISELQESPDNPRQSFDKVALDELARSIKSEGIQVPLIVRIFDDEARYELIAGHRRLRAARIAGQTAVPCILRRFTDEEARTARIIENLLREDLQPLDEAEAYQQMFAAAGADHHPLTPADLAAKIGKPESYVRLRLKLLAGEPAVQDALRKQHITLGHALELARLDKSLQKDLLKFCLYTPWGQKRETPVSIAELKKHIAQNVMLVLASAPFKTDDATLIPNAGACTDCKNRTGNNRVLFSDVKQGDVCTLPSCFQAKVARSIDITLEQLRAANTPAVKITDSYSRSSQTPNDALTTSQYEVVAKGRSCDALKVGIYIDGQQQGKRVNICTNSKCTVHKVSAAMSTTTPGQKEKRAKARKEAAVRARIFAAIHAAASDVDLEDADYLLLAEYALTRADHNGLMKLTKLLGWPKDLFGWDGKTKLRAKLNEIGVDLAVVIALLASVSHELSVNEFNIGKAERLEALAKAFSVNTATIRNEVEAELAAKTATKSSPASKPTVTSKTTAPAPKKAIAKKAQ